MKIAISATDRSLDAEVDPRFGRCCCFVIVDPETMQAEYIENTSAMAGGGAGISAAQMIVNEDVSAVLTGNCGPNAYQVLSAANIQVITGVSGKIKDAIQNYKSGRYQATSEPNVSAHHGTAHGTGTVSGGGGEKELELPHDWLVQSPDTKDELNVLRDHTRALEAQLSAIQKSIEDLGKK